jgi:hypothetical protein
MAFQRHYIRLKGVPLLGEGIGNAECWNGLSLFGANVATWYEQTWIGSERFQEALELVYFSLFQRGEIGDPEC